MAWAISSLPVPLSPKIRTRPLVAAISPSCWRRAFMGDAFTDNLRMSAVSLPKTANLALQLALFQGVLHYNSGLFQE